MQLLDLSQVMYSVILGTQHKNDEMSIDLVRHMMLNAIRRLNKKFRNKYGELVICCDGKGPTWRKEFFPHYKAGRKKRGEEDKWKEIHTITSQFKEELREVFPYKFMNVPKAEADDVIATLAIHRAEAVLIISSDKDFIQLHGKGVEQYDMIRDKFITSPNPDEYLIEHIIKGDRGDGIPNILSDDDCFVSGKRQITMTAGRFEQSKDFFNKTISAENFNEVPVQGHNLGRNRKLIDLTLIPKKITDDILNQWQSQTKRDRSKILPYFVKNQLRELTFSLGDF